MHLCQSNYERRCVCVATLSQLTTHKSIFTFQNQCEMKVKMKMKMKIKMKMKLKFYYFMLIKIVF